MGIFEAVLVKIILEWHYWQDAGFALLASTCALSSTMRASSFTWRHHGGAPAKLPPRLRLLFLLPVFVGELAT